MSFCLLLLFASQLSPFTLFFFVCLRFVDKSQRGEVIDIIEEVGRVDELPDHFPLDVGRKCALKADWRVQRALIFVPFFLS